MELFEVKITALGNEGQGIGSLPSGKVCFAAGAFPGEKCLCRVISETSKYAVCDVRTHLTEHLLDTSRRPQT